MKVNYFCPHYGTCTTPMHTGKCKDDCKDSHKPTKTEKVFLAVKCKKCRHRHTEKCPMRFEDIREGNDSHGFPYGVRLVYDRTTDEGFCHLGEK